VARLDWYIRSNLKPRQMQLLVALDELRQVGAVANYLNITQSAASKALAELEKALGLQLFMRTGRGVKPTLFGESLIRNVRLILATLAKAEEELRTLAAGADEGVSIGTLASATLSLLPRSLATYKRAHPAAVVLVREGSMESLIAALRAGDLDFVVGTLPLRAWSDRLDEKILRDEPTYLLARKDHPLADGRPLHWAELVRWPWVLPPPGSILRYPMDLAFEQAGVHPTDWIETVSVRVIQKYLQSGDALGCLSEQFAQDAEVSGALKILNFDLRSLSRPLGISWLRDKPLEPPALEFVAHLERASFELWT
jgi:DNA-binding transcriptional LysR family regulator